MNPDTDLASYLANAGIGLTVGSNCHVCDMFPVIEGDTERVFVFVDSSGTPEPYIGTGISYYSVTVRVLVVGQPDNRSSGLTLAKSILAAGHLAPVDGYVSVTANESHPTDIDDDDAGRKVWGLGFTMTYVA